MQYRQRSTADVLCSLHPVFFSCVYPFIHLSSSCLFVFLHVRLAVCMFDYASVISVQALSDCTDVWLAVHPDLSENPFALF